MKSSVLRALVVVLIMAAGVLPCRVFAQERSHADNLPDAAAESTGAVPQLSEIIPLSAELTVRLAVLESKMTDRPDLSALEKQYDQIRASITGLIEQFQQLKDSDDYSPNTFVDLSNAVNQEKDALEQASKPINQEVRQLGEYREEWLAEKQRWQQWQDALIQQRGLEQLSSTFEQANNTIEKALSLVLPQLETLFRLQEKGAAIHASLQILDNALDGLSADKLRGELDTDTPSILSTRFFSQLMSREMWLTVKDGLYETAWPVKRFVSQQGWILSLQILISLFVIIAIYKKRSVLRESERWHFLAKRPFSAGLFLGYVTVMLVYENQGTPAIFKQALSIVGVISFVRLFAGLIQAQWKKRCIYGVMVFLVVTTLMEMFSFPLALFRLYTVAAAVLALIFCWRCARRSLHREDPGIYAWGLRLTAVFFAFVLLTELWGKATLPFYLLSSFIRSLAVVLFFMLFLYMVRGGLEKLFRTSPMKRTALIFSHTDVLIHRVGLFIDIALWAVLIVPAVLVIWGAYDNLEGAIGSILGLGFNIGNQRINVGLLAIAAGLVYAAFVLSWTLQNVLMDRLLFKREVEKGVRVSIKRLVHYFIVCVGFLFAVSIIGFEVTKLTIILSALGVGIGFGLQGVVNNFVSGLILLFERPVRVGDYIEMNNNWSEIKKIGLRATTVQTFDQADVIIPNADLVTNQVINWTLSNRKTRIILPVGVAYGSDIPLVIDTLIACAKAHPKVVETPAPQVLFLRFGDSALAFELRVWILDVDYKLPTLSELNQEIDRRFREAKIEIAFPQLDLHVRTPQKREDVPLKARETPSGKTTGPKEESSENEQ